MYAKLKSTGEIVEVEYDDDDLYIVKNRGFWVYRHEFEYIDDEVIDIMKLKDILNSLPESYFNISIDSLITKILQITHENSIN